MRNLNRGHPKMKGGKRANAGRKPGSHTINQLINMASSDRWIDSAIFEHIRDNLRITEVEVRERFRILNECYHWFTVERSQEGFPDFLLQNNGHNLVRAEVEYKAKDFITHRHDVSGCDLIICWRNDWASCPIPILTIAGEWFNYEQLKHITPFLLVKTAS